MMAAPKVTPTTRDDVPEMPPFTGKINGESQLAANNLVGKTRVILEEMVREVCAKGGSPGFKIISGSMTPMIDVDDVVRVSRVQAAHVHIGDIVAFQNGKTVVVHRIIWKTRPGKPLYFRQMGDDCRASARFPASNLIGKVKIIQKKGFEINLDSPFRVIQCKFTGYRMLIYDVFHRKLRRSIRRRFFKLFRSNRPSRRANVPPAFKKEI
jgi:signal peptidase I